MMESPFEMFQRRDSGEAELREAAERLGPVAEPPSFWSAIANDASRHATHRGLAVVELVRRHVVPGATTLGLFARMLDGASWLADDDVTAITEISGKVPVRWSPGDTVTSIALPGSRGAIYLAISGSYSALEIAAALHGVWLNTRISAAVIRDTGFNLEG